MGRADTEADVAGRIDWSMVSVDSASCRAHQHAGGAPRCDKRACVFHGTVTAASIRLWIKP